jgi:hypothetical protein
METFWRGEVEKFSGSWGEVDRTSHAQAVQAFSHWTWQVTEGELMVVGLQVASRGI